MKRKILSLNLLIILTMSGLGIAASERDHEHYDNHGHDEESAMEADHHESSDGYEHDEEGHGHDEENEHDEEGHERDEDHGHEEEGVTRIKDEMAREVGIEVSPVGKQTLNQKLVTYGNIATGNDQLSHVKARFPGLIQSVQINVGDEVRKGDLLARIESNDSLRTYNIKAPISGKVIQRHANTGEFADNQVLFSIANFDTLWAEFRIYPSQVAMVAIGQSVEFKAVDRVVAFPIRHIVPVSDKPYQVARVKFKNEALGMAPGMLVEGGVDIGKFDVEVAVQVEAVQNLGGLDGVFVKEGEEYRFAPLMLGRSDGKYVEVISGIRAGQEYVSKNSYLIKADIEKSEAEHEH